MDGVHFMRYLIDHDYHIHSRLSDCSDDPGQTPEVILQYARERGFSQIVLTNHFWDHRVYVPDYGFYNHQSFERLKEELPLPQCEGVEFLFGGECDMDQNGVIGATAETVQELDFLIVPTTHLHLTPFTMAEGTSLEERAKLYIRRIECLLNADLPFHKVGLAHPTDCIADGDDHLQVLDMIPDTEYGRVFSGLAAVGAGFELNFEPRSYRDEDLPRVLRPYRIAREVGCKFYLGSDVHESYRMPEVMDRFNAIVDALELTEEDKFRLR